MTSIWKRVSNFSQKLSGVKRLYLWRTAKVSFNL
jgi:hypothetical protein